RGAAADAQQAARPFAGRGGIGRWCGASTRPRHQTSSPNFVYRYPDKQYQSWLGANFTRIGIDFDYDKGFLDRVYAGIANHFFDYSFRSALKLVENKSREDKIPLFEKKFDQVERRFFETSHAFLSAKRPTVLDEHAGVLHAELFLMRLLS